MNTPLYYPGIKSPADVYPQGESNWAMLQQMIGNLVIIPSSDLEKLMHIQCEGILTNYRWESIGPQGYFAMAHESAHYEVAGDSKMELATIGIPRVQNENTDLRLQVERLKTMYMQERVMSARQSHQNEELLKRLDKLTDELRAQRTERRQSLKVTVDTLREFYRLMAIWKTTTVHLSNITEKCLHPAYKEITAMGQRVLPLIFSELAREPDHWFAALRTLTGINPVPLQSRGRLAEMTNAWIEWARHHGYFSGNIAEAGFSTPQLADIFGEEPSNA
jgi:hypothetical protein